MDPIDVPLRFERIFLEKVWGGRALERSPGLKLPEGLRVGETWELVDRADVNSVVAGGPHAGRTLRELMEQAAGDLLGRSKPNREGRFPLLVKYIDATENLSVQVHPDEAAAKQLGAGAEAKTEAWYFLGAETGARILAGVEPDVDAERFAAVARGSAGAETVDALLRSHAVVPGTGYHVPGGTVHAIGAGVTLLEVQQNSDTTYRIWDWDRVGLDGEPRETHVDEACVCAALGVEPSAPVAPRWTAEGPGVESAPIACSRSFEMDVLRVGARAVLPSRDRFQVLVAVEGGGAIEVERGEGRWRLERGDTWLVPAAAGDAVVAPEGPSLTLIHMRSGD